MGKLICYLGDEGILQKYAKSIRYTTKLEELCDLYDKIKADIPIHAGTADDTSTATLSNCSSLSPRMSPSGLSSEENKQSKEEIHYFAEEVDDENEEDFDLSNKHQNGLSFVKYKDSPRPQLNRTMSKELKLPNRAKN